MKHDRDKQLYSEHQCASAEVIIRRIFALLTTAELQRQPHAASAELYLRLLLPHLPGSAD